MNFASSSITFLACSPGNFVSVAVIISYPHSSSQWMVSSYCGGATAEQVCVRTRKLGCAPPRRGDLIYAVEARSFFGGNVTAGDSYGFGEFHLRFQRTLPSFASSIIIP